MRTAAPGDFQASVEEFGEFTFGRRTPRDVFKIRGEYARLTDGNFADDGSFGDFTAFAFATIKQMMVAAPSGFDLSKLDPLLDEQWEVKTIRIFQALREKELSFRPGPGEAMQATGA